MTVRKTLAYFLTASILSDAAHADDQWDGFVKCSQVYAFYNHGLAEKFSQWKPKGLIGAVGDILYVSFSKVPPSACTPGRTMLATESKAWQAHWDRRQPFPWHNPPSYSRLNLSYLIRDVVWLESYTDYPCEVLEPVPGEHIGFFTYRLRECRVVPDDPDGTDNVLRNGYLKE